jgi:hypothetical protein
MAAGPTRGESTERNAGQLGFADQRFEFPDGSFQFPVTQNKFPVPTPREFLSKWLQILPNFATMSASARPLQHNSLYFPS